MPWEPLNHPDGSRSRPTPLNEILDRVRAGLGSPPASNLAVVEEVWTDLVGPAAARALTPVGIRDGALIVVAEDPMWVGQARWLENAVVSGLAPLLGPDVVRSIRAREPERPG